MTPIAGGVRARERRGFPWLFLALFRWMGRDARGAGPRQHTGKHGRSAFIIFFFFHFVSFSFLFGHCRNSPVWWIKVQHTQYLRKGGKKTCLEVCQSESQTETRNQALAQEVLFFFPFFFFSMHIMQNSYKERLEKSKKTPREIDRALERAESPECCLTRGGNRYPPASPSVWHSCDYIIEIFFYIYIFLIQSIKERKLPQYKKKKTKKPRSPTLQTAW